jgi:hypothetical protein
MVKGDLGLEREARRETAGEEGGAWGWDTTSSLTTMQGRSCFPLHVAKPLVLHEGLRASHAPHSPLQCVNKLPKRTQERKEREGGVGTPAATLILPSSTHPFQVFKGNALQHPRSKRFLKQQSST